jgi:phage terminase small subunit
MKLTPQQQRFCEEYIKDLNAKQAYIRAGYSEKTAEKHASRMLYKPQVQSQVQRLMDKRTLRTNITTDHIVVALEELASRCMQAEPVMVYDKKSATYVQQTDDNGRPMFTFNSSGALKALELLGKHLGMFRESQEQQSAAVIINWNEERTYNQPSTQAPHTTKEDTRA